MAGLPNITGYGGGNYPYPDVIPAAESALYPGNGITLNGISWMNTNHALLMDASRASSIYGASNTVTPESYKVTWVVRY